VGFRGFLPWEKRKLWWGESDSEDCCLGVVARNSEGIRFLRVVTQNMGVIRVAVQKVVGGVVFRGWLYCAPAGCLREDGGLVVLGDEGDGRWRRCVVSEEVHRAG
jgi:hypothetical protein